MGDSGAPWRMGDDPGGKSTVSQFQDMGRLPRVQLVSSIVIKIISYGGGVVSCVSRTARLKPLSRRKAPGPHGFWSRPDRLHS